MTQRPIRRHPKGSLSQRRMMPASLYTHIAVMDPATGEKWRVPLNIRRQAEHQGKS